jgi:hypothetical protein
LIAKIGSWLLIIPSLIIGILLVELVFRLPPLRNARHVSKYSERVIFFDGRDTIFRNVGDIFTYVPHDDIRNLTEFFSADDFTIEYDYRFRTNNYGLVQDTDIVPDRQSLLLLGDSFTEGQGAEPWFRLVSSEINQLGYQGINGGLMATGFSQWLKLDQYLLTEKMRVQKLLVLFISQDYHRPVVQMPPVDFQCLAAIKACALDQSYFYRLPPPEELPWWIAKIRAARGPMIKIWLKERLATLLPATYDVYKYFTYRFLNLGRAEEASRAAIGEFIRLHGPENVAFLHLPEKDEIDNGPNYLGLKARRSIRDAGGKLFDGFKLCQLTAADYYPNDDHPNRTGYAKIASCATGVMKEMTAGPK